MKKLWEKIKTISVGTWVRTILLIVALINQALTMFGYCPLPFSDEQLNEFLTTAFTAIAALVAWWENNSFTAAAIEADKQLKK
jgi:SPP1 family holin